MSHEIETMMYVGKKPWHGLGKAIPEGKKLSVPEAITAAGLDWEVGMQKVYVNASYDKKQYPALKDYMATYRKTDNKILGIVSEKYTPLQNKDAFHWFQPFLDANAATLATAGSLYEGRRIWVLAKIADCTAGIKGSDEVSQYILLSNSHDGSLAVRVGFTPIRVVCNNTLCMAHESKASKLLKVRHSSGLKANLELVRETMNIATQEFDATIKQYREMASKEITSVKLEKYVRKVFNIEKTGGDKLLPKIIYLFENGRGSREAGKTYWGAYNAVNGYFNYFRGKTQENTLNSIWFGESAELNRKALNVALEMAA